MNAFNEMFFLKWKIQMYTYVVPHINLDQNMEYYDSCGFILYR